MGNYFRSAKFGSSDSTLPTCNCKGKPEGYDYSNCVLFQSSEYCGLEYDFRSIMHYSLGNVMTPHDSSVTEVGNTRLSDGDIAKIQCLYHCDKCGGHIEGTRQEMNKRIVLFCELFIGFNSGVVEYSGSQPKTCRWLIRNEEGFKIRLITENLVRET